VVSIALVLALVSADAPAFFRVQFTATCGNIVLNITRAHAPLGVDRFYELVQAGYFGTNDQNANAFFRVVPNFVVQFGISGDPAVSRVWKNKSIRDDPVIYGNKKGTIAFATAGPNTRTTQLFINFVDNSFLDPQGFAAFGIIDTGFDVALKIYAKDGQRPSQDAIYNQGNAYLKQNFPNLDYIKSATVLA